MKRAEAAYAAHCEPVVGFEYPREDTDTEEHPPVDLRAIQVKSLEFMSRLILSARTDRSRHITVSVGLAMVKGELNVASIAEHFGVTYERVRRVVKDIQRFESW